MKRFDKIKNMSQAEFLEYLNNWLSEKVEDFNSFIPSLWEDKLNNMLNNNSVMLQCVNRKYEGVFDNQGDSVLAQGGQYLYADQKKFFACKVNDVARAQANQSIMEEHLKNAKSAIEDVQDSYILNKCIIHAEVFRKYNCPENPIKLDAKTIYNEFKKLASNISKFDYSIDNQKPWVVISPCIECYILQSPNFTHAHNINDKTLRKGAIGRFAEMDVMVSQNVPRPCETNVIIAGTNEAITFVSQLLKIESLHDRNNFTDLIRGLCLYGANVVESKALAVMFAE